MSIYYHVTNGTIIITGRTFQYREHIKAVGARFNGVEKNWFLALDDANLEKVKELCSLAGGGATNEAIETAKQPTPALTRVTIDETDERIDDGEADVSALRSPGDLTVSELMDRLQHVVAISYPRPVWIIGEIQNLAIKNGVAFFNLAEAKGDAGEGATVTIRASIWKNSLRDLRVRHGEAKIDEVLQEGLKIRCLVSVGLFKDRGHISLAVQDIDPIFTKGALALAREALLRELRSKGLDRANKSLTMSKFPFRIGLVSADGSRAQGDFLDQLKEYGFCGEVVFFPATMQGDGTPIQVQKAVETLTAFGCDAIAITRGGGSAADLRWFDDHRLVYALVSCPVPLIIAVGHHDDTCVAEEIAFRREKTPTAAADFIVSVFAETRQNIDAMAAQMAFGLERFATVYADRLSDLGEKLGAATERAFARRRESILNLSWQLAAGSERLMMAAREKLLRWGADLHRQASEGMNCLRDRLNDVERKLLAVDPKWHLEEGWVKLFGPRGHVRSIADVVSGETLRTRLKDGRLVLNVTDVKDLSKDASDKDEDHG